VIEGRLDPLFRWVRARVTFTATMRLTKKRAQFVGYPYEIPAAELLRVVDLRDQTILDGIFEKIAHHLFDCFHRLQRTSVYGPRRLAPPISKETALGTATFLLADSSYPRPTSE
jgi:hypothetical protein